MMCPFYLRLFTPPQFSTPRVDACTNRALLLRTPRSSRLTVTRTFVNVTFCTMFRPARLRNQVDPFNNKKWKKRKNVKNDARARGKRFNGRSDIAREDQLTKWGKSAN